MKKLLAPILVGAAVLGVLGTGPVGRAGAATGGTFLLGRSNSATSTTLLSNGAGVPLELRAKAGSRPFSVNSTVVVPRLNADRLDGLSSEQLQRRVRSTCPSGQALSGLGADGSSLCVGLEPAGVLQSRVVHGLSTRETAIAYTPEQVGVSVVKVGSACALRFTQTGAFPTTVAWSGPLTRATVEPGETATTTASTNQLQQLSWSTGAATIFLTYLPASTSCAYQGIVSAR